MSAYYMLYLCSFYVYVCLSHTGGTRAFFVLHLATCQWAIKAELEKRAKKGERQLKGSNTELRQETDLLVLEVFGKAWTNPIGDVKSSFPVVGGDLSSHVPVEW